MTRQDKIVVGVSLLAFILAGMSGVLFRWGMTGGTSFGFLPGNIRHAHSHLMYFSWATPALMVLLVPNDRWVRFWAWAGMILGFVAFPFFLLFGYSSASVGAASMPPAVILSGLIMITWYGFVVRWYRVQQAGPLEIAAVAFLVLSSMGAWGLSAIIPLGFSNASWAESFKVMFLGYFTEGWLTLAGVAAAAKSLKAFDFEERQIPTTIISILCLGIGTSWLLGMPLKYMTPTMQWIARLGALLSGVGFSWIALKLWGMAKGWWKLPVGSLALKAVSLVFLAPWPTIWWAEQHQDRILFLHLLLLGIISTTIILTTVPGKRIAHPYYVSVILLLVMLVPVSSVWILPSVAFTWIHLIGPFSLLPVLAAIPIAAHLLRSRDLLKSP